MRVGLDLLYLIPGETGGRESYARELVPAMLARSGELELVAFVNRDADRGLAAELGERVNAVTVPVSARSRAQWSFGELALVALAARRAGVELLHSMANFGPPWGPFRRVLTIHDLQYKAVPDLFSMPLRAATSALVSLASHRAHRIIAVSGAGRDEIVAGLGIASERIDVVPNGVRPAPPATEPSQMRERLELAARPLALTVATNLAHKNLSVLFQALAMLEPPARPVLALAGHGTDDPQLRETASAAGVARDVRLMGSLPAGELEGLYATSSLLVLPSLHEGFGLPVLEAMARGVPVACSDLAALREVGGDDVLYFDPRAPEQIAAVISRLLGDAELAARLSASGAARAARFSWEAAAEGTLATYARALGAPAPEASSHRTGGT